MIPQNRILIETDASFGINCANAHELEAVMDQAVWDLSRLKECDMKLYLEATEKNNLYLTLMTHIRQSNKRRLDK